MTMTLRISDEDSRLIKDFAKLHGISASEFMRRAALEKIEDELDVRAAEKAYAEYLADPVTYSHEEMGRLLGLSEDADA
ncbi:MAG: hypothetical protein IJH03_05315 [Clostridia bacterium]|nr:hypothetical protein [Clostridia bacterium]MBQ9039790.1 hypothetical protein [Clostridia bacterium]